MSDISSSTEIIEWLNSDEGSKWSRSTHKRVEHHALIEVHDDLPSRYTRSVSGTVTYVETTEYDPVIDWDAKWRPLETSGTAARAYLAPGDKYRLWGVDYTYDPDTTF